MSDFTMEMTGVTRKGQVQFSISDAKRIFICDIWVDPVKPEVKEQEGQPWEATRLLTHSELSEKATEIAKKVLLGEADYIRAVYSKMPPVTVTI
jgi:hypothetical protein